MNVNEQSHAGAKGLWAILWRSMVFMPYMLLVFLCVGSVALSLWVLPVFLAFWIYFGQWHFVGGALVIWLVALWIYRRFRLSRFFKSTASDWRARV
jgi:hypothetical protein